MPASAESIKPFITAAGNRLPGKKHVKVMHVDLPVVFPLGDEVIFNYLSYN
jgi:hypothetical protein